MAEPSQLTHNQQMSLSIDSRYITAVFALGQWFEIEDDSFCVDAYELRYWDGSADLVDKFGDRVHCTDFQMGSLYEKEQPEYHCFNYGPNSPRAASMTPQGHHGVCFIEKATGQRVSLSLMEVRAFREGKRYAPD
jgi:hypothetical protein